MWNPSCILSRIVRWYLCVVKLINYTCKCWLDWHQYIYLEVIHQPFETSDIFVLFTL